MMDLLDSFVMVYVCYICGFVPYIYVDMCDICEFQIYNYICDLVAVMQNKKRIDQNFTYSSFTTAFHVAGGKAGIS